jgi:hypothetical protein
MRYDQAMRGVPAARQDGMADEETGARLRAFGPLIKILLGLIIAVDVSLLAAPLYYGTFSPCRMIALSKASLHSSAVDEEIGLADEIAADVYHVSSVWVNSRAGFVSCASDVGGRTLSALIP